MKACIESTSRIVAMSVKGCDVLARVWEGTSEHGVPCLFYVTRVAVRDAPGVDHSQFQKELEEQKQPSAEVAALPSRLIL